MNVRPAVESDVEEMSRIIGRYAAQGVMLPRSRDALVGSLKHYMVAEIDGSVVGCGGLQPYTATCGEIYGLATCQAAGGTGRAIVNALLENARSKHLSQVFALTLAPGFFQKLGFRTVEHQDLPMKVWKDCVSCPKFGNCDEIAMVLDLN